MEKIKAFGICLYKKDQNTIEVLLCKSVVSRERWGFLKGVALKNETPQETALREFYEESGISVEKKDLEDFFIQKNEFKDIGIYLVNCDSLKDIDRYFNHKQLKNCYLSHENCEVKFFSLEKLPLMKKKQLHLTQEIVAFLTKH